MAVEVAGTWELGWSAPKTEMDLWWAVMRSYDIQMLHMTPVSGLQHKMLTEYDSYDDILETTELTPVFVHEGAETELDDFVHPDDALYVFGKANFSPFAAFGEGRASVRIDCPQPGMFWPHQALALVMRHRGRP